LGSLSSQISRTHHTASDFPDKEDKVAVKQDGAQQQQANAPQQQQAASSPSHTQPATENHGQMQQGQAQAEQANGSASEQGTVSEPSFSQLLAQQVSQAIQPVLDEFQQQVAQTLERSSEATSQAGQGGQTAQPSIQEAQPAQPEAPPQGEQTLFGKAAQVAQAPQSTVKDALRPALKSVEEAVERNSKDMLQAWLAAGLTMLLTETTRTLVQQSADQGLHTLTQKAFESAPDGLNNNHEVQTRTEAALQTVVHRSLDALFAEGMRATVQREGQAVIQESFRGDFSSALKDVEDILKAVGEALLNMLREQWRMLLRLALGLALLALAGSLETKPQQQAT
jgi:BMFP domain-containing protein YqiC